MSTINRVWHIHKWGKWIDSGWANDGPNGAPALAQYRDCAKCGKRKVRFSDE